MGIVKRWHRAKAAAVIAECGTGKTLMALSAIHVRSAGRPYSALVMAPPNIVGKWCREVLITVPGARVFVIDGLRTPGQSGANPHGVNEVRYRNGRIVREGLHTTLTDLRLRKNSKSARDRWQKDLSRSGVLCRWPRQGKAFLLLEALLRGGEVRPMPGDCDQS
jgi:SNF2 family DNA or RNA helicase